jgi:hypothetical protein
MILLNRRFGFGVSGPSTPKLVAGRNTPLSDSEMRRVSRNPCEVTMGVTRLTARRSPVIYEARCLPDCFARGATTKFVPEVTK